MEVIDVIILKVISFIFPLIIGFEVGHFYSKDRFEQEYRDGFKRGYSLGKMESGVEE